MKEHVPPLSPEPQPTPTMGQRAADEQPRPAPRTQVESPQAFYERITQREDVRWLLKKLARR